MMNPKSELILTSWQLISLVAASLVILGLAGFGLWNLLILVREAFNAQARNAVRQELIGQWEGKASGKSSQYSSLIVFADKNKVYIIEYGEVFNGSFQVMDTSAKPQKIIFTFEVNKGTSLSKTFELIDDQQLSRVEDNTNFQKISNVGVLPKEEIYKPLELEGRNKVGIFSRALQAMYLENSEFTANLADIGLGISDETKNYKYTIDVMDKKQMVRVIATPKQEDLKSFIGIVFLENMGNYSRTKTIICESLQASTAIPPRPSIAATPTCPEGFRLVK